MMAEMRKKANHSPTDVHIGLSQIWQGLRCAQFFDDGPLRQRKRYRLSHRHSGARAAAAGSASLGCTGWPRYRRLRFRLSRLAARQLGSRALAHVGRTASASRGIPSRRQRRLGGNSSMGQPAGGAVPRCAPRRRIRHVVRQGAGLGSLLGCVAPCQCRRHQPARRRTLGSGRRPRLQVVHAAVRQRVRAARPRHPGARARRRAGFAGFRLVRLGAVALRRVLGGAGGGHRGRRQRTHGGDGFRPPSVRLSP